MLIVNGGNFTITGILFFGNSIFCTPFSPFRENRLKLEIRFLEKIGFLLDHQAYRILGTEPKKILRKTKYDATHAGYIKINGIIAKKNQFNVSSFIPSMLIVFTSNPTSGINIEVKVLKELENPNTSLVEVE